MNEKMKMINKSVWGWIKKNRLAVFYFFLAIAIEMVAVWAVEGSPFLDKPFICLGLLLLNTATVLLIKNNRARLIVYACLLGLQAVLGLVMAVIYDMTGQYFDFGMLNLRNDAFGILESIPVNFVTFYTGLFCCIVFIVYGLRFCRLEGQVEVGKKHRIGYIACLVAGLAAAITSVLFYYPTASNKYKEMIDGKSTGAYSSYGVSGNTFGELFKTVFLKDRTVLSSETMDSFLYKETSKPTDYFGVSKGNNLVVIVGETFEWYSFLVNDEYPKALGLSNEQLKKLLPNLWSLYENSVAMTNFHSKEKTDISETLSIMGSYPTGAYINYDYSENTLPQTLPNVFKLFDEKIVNTSYHNGFKTFYNRDEAHEILGFVDGVKTCPIDMYDMEDMSNDTEDNGGESTFTEYMDAGTRNLDSEMIETCKDLMFPTDKRFCTYITTITMHGMYYERPNLEGEHNRLLTAMKETFGADYNLEEQDEQQQILFHYMTTALEFDDAIGSMMKDLERKGLRDNTTVVVFGDHDAYYQKVSGYVKDIYAYDDEGLEESGRNFTDLYKVPLMIYDTKLNAKIKEKGGAKWIDKFACTSDIVPTLFDLFGINYYTNMYYGHSVFSKEQSVLYSRAYNFFLSDGIYGRSVNNVMYMHDSVTKGEFLAYQKEATALVERIRHCDYIFKQDYFSKKSNMDTYVAKMRAINP